MSCSSFYSNPLGVQSIEYLKLLLFRSPFVSLERDVFELTEISFVSEKIKPRYTCYNSPHIEICGMRCNTFREKL